jgi:hypothetical protein
VRQVRRLLAITGILSAAAAGAAIGIGQAAALAYVHFEVPLPF